MAHFAPGFLRTARHYLGKISTLRAEIRTVRFMNSLPADIRKDIGWPERYTERHADHR
ncbi:MAG: hypothetical protein WBA88_04430 [Pseudaminobacter sp.]